MSDVMHGIEQDVPFDFAAADALIGSCRAAATTIDEQVPTRATYVTTALKDFKGHFSALFSGNADTAKTDAAELAIALRSTAQYATRLKEEARKEQQRRETARRWKQEQDDRWWGEKAWDSAFGDDAPPVGPAAEPITTSVTPPASGQRQTPPPGSGGGGGGGTSSARPSDLHGFATGSAALNTALLPKKTRAKTDYDHFVETCHWGTLSADGVFTGFSAWLRLNDADVTWANTVGNAFAAAGSEGAVSTLTDAALAASLRAADVSASRQDLSIDPPTAYGHPPTTGYADDPVNTATGNFVETEADLGFAGGAATLMLTRTYNSVNDRIGGFGPGWSSWTESRLEIGDEGAQFFLPDGRMLTFPRRGAGWDRAVADNFWLTEVDGAYEVGGNDGARWTLAATGELTTCTTGPGTAVRLIWSDQRLVRLEHERGRWIELSWSGDLVRAARTDDDRWIDYRYDERGRLTAATSVAGTRTYGWNEAGLIANITGLAGVVEVDNDYDERGRVTRQRSPFGRESRYVYLPGRITVVSDPDGERANTWLADERGRLIGVVDSEQRRQSTSYDAYGNPVVITERDGAVTVQEYDARGRLVRRVLPTGGELAWTYDDVDRVIGVTLDTDATTTLSYQGSERGPSTVVDPEGGRTTLTWQDGLLTAMTDPTGVTLRFGHDEHGDLASMTAADGGVVSLERDRSGLLLAVVSAGGHRTAFGYDVAGRMTLQRLADGSDWTFAYSDDGQLTSITDPTGAQQRFEHGLHGEPIRAIDALGRTTEREYDDLGLLEAVVPPDGGRWEFRHDAMSRLVQILDPTGAGWLRSYDAVGRLATLTDPTGITQQRRSDPRSGIARIEDPEVGVGLRTDRLGRVVATQDIDGSSTLTRYDRCGRIVEQIDARGGLTRIRRDAAGRVVEVTDPGGGVRAFAYDVCGRLSTLTDETGGLTRFARDLDGRIISETWPDQSVVEYSHDALGRVIRRRTPGLGTRTARHDALGRLLETTDPFNGRRRFGYDAVGRLVEATDGNGHTTTYAYDDADRLVAIIDPLGARRTRRHDAAGRLVAETDPLGRTTEVGYDDAGRQIWQLDPTGTRTEWEYDEAGRLAAVRIDGELRRSIDRDFAARTVSVHEHLDDQVTEHRLTWDACGALVARTRDGVGPHWRYDAAGRLVERTAPDGTATTYQRDAAGRLVGVDHPLLGRAVLELDRAGRVHRATTAAGVSHAWTYADGFVVGHRSGTQTTTIERDAQDRVVRVRSTKARDMSFGYDAAGQLVESAIGDTRTRWTYDAAGRITGEATPDALINRRFDASGQLLSEQTSDGETTYSYDAAGRRTSRTGSDGSREMYRWDDFGWLAGLERYDSHEGEQHLALRVDALGELAAVGTTQVWTDSADPWRRMLQVGDTSVVDVGPLHGFGGGWHSDWRGVRGAGADPWRPDLVAGLGAGPGSGLGIGGAGELLIGGLEWMGSRVYEAASRSFLSADPLDPPTGAGWAGNRYSFAGNNPVAALDPLGLSPVTDAELAAYTQAHQGWATPVTNWVADNWEYIAAGAMVVAGGVMVATGFGGPIGMGLISAGIDTGIQKFTTGKVDWGQVAVSGALGTVGAGVTGVLGAAGRGGAAALRTSIMVNAGVGATSSEATYLIKNDPSTWTWQGAGGAAAGGGLAGAVGGLAGPAGGSIARQVGGSSTGVVAHLTTGAINFGGGFSGSAANDLINGREVNYASAAFSGAVNAGGSEVAGRVFPSRGTATLDQNSYFGPRTVSGATNFGAPNTQSMWGSAGSGAAIGAGGDFGNPF